MAQLGIPEESIQKIISQELPQRMEGILKALLEGAFNFLTGISLIVTQLVNIVIIPFVTIYLIIDFPLVQRRIRDFVPSNRREQIEYYQSKIEQLLGKYFRGAIIVAIIQGIIASIVLTILGVNYALVLGLMTAILDFIPYVGLFISLIVSSIVALLSGEPSWLKVIGVVIMYLSQKLFENVYLAPKIIGKSVGIHPVLLIMSLFIFSHFLGFIGLLIAVPVTAAIIMLFALWKEKRLYQENKSDAQQ